MSHGQEDLPLNVREGDQDIPQTSVPIPKPVNVIPFPLNSASSNDPSQLGLAIYFDPEKPNLALDFGLDGLQPVIRQMGGDIFLLQDSSGKFYKWSNWDGQMWQFEGLTAVQDAFNAIMRDSGTLKKTQIWNMQRPDPI